MNFFHIVAQRQILTIQFQNLKFKVSACGQSFFFVFKFKSLFHPSCLSAQKIVNGLVLYPYITISTLTYVRTVLDTLHRFITLIVQSTSSYIIPRDIHIAGGAVSIYITARPVDFK